jgi:hypothetical protein
MSSRFAVSAILSRPPYPPEFSLDMGFIARFTHPAG